ERHTGSGLTATEIASARLPLPIRDMLPVTVEERLICYADKFYSKSKPDIELSIDMIEGSLSVYGEQVLIRFRKLNSEFNPKNAYFK
ncbi:MAG: phosphohydrolase, partial [Bacteroidales bacterium]